MSDKIGLCDLVNGVVKGHGQGSSKQMAKEEAAKQAYYQMGWGATREFPACFKAALSLTCSLFSFMSRHTVSTVYALIYFRNVLSSLSICTLKANTAAYTSICTTDYLYE